MANFCRTYMTLYEPAHVATSSKLCKNLLDHINEVKLHTFDCLYSLSIRHLGNLGSADYVSHKEGGWGGLSSTPR